MISDAEVRMARGGLGWPVRELAANADVSTTTIIRIERGCRVMAQRVAPPEDYAKP